MTYWLSRPYIPSYNAVPLQGQAKNAFCIFAFRFQASYRKQLVFWIQSEHFKIWPFLYNTLTSTLFYVISSKWSIIQIWYYVGHTQQGVPGRHPYLHMLGYTTNAPVVTCWYLVRLIMLWAAGLYRGLHWVGMIGVLSPDRGICSHVVLQGGLFLLYGL